MRQRSLGLDYLIVEITDITGKKAECIDQYERYLDVRTDIRRGNGLIPRVGETWVLDKTIGDRWTFAACLTPRVPTVLIGSTDANPALKAVIALLVDLGFAVDGTTDDQLRAAHPHTHSIPSTSTQGGGDPSHTHGISTRTSGTNSA